MVKPPTNEKDNDPAKDKEDQDESDKPVRNEEGAYELPPTLQQEPGEISGEIVGESPEGGKTGGQGDSGILSQNGNASTGSPTKNSVQGSNRRGSLQSVSDGKSARTNRTGSKQTGSVNQNLNGKTPSRVTSRQTVSTVKFRNGHRQSNFTTIADARAGHSSVGSNDKLSSGDKDGSDGQTRSTPGAPSAPKTRTLHSGSGASSPTKTINTKISADSPYESFARDKTRVWQANNKSKPQVIKSKEGNAWIIKGSKVKGNGQFSELGDDDDGDDLLKYLRARYRDYGTKFSFLDKKKKRKKSIAPTKTPAEPETILPDVNIDDSHGYKLLQPLPPPDPNPTHIMRKKLTSAKTLSRVYTKPYKKEDMNVEYENKKWKNPKDYTDYVLTPQETEMYSWAKVIYKNKTLLDRGARHKRFLEAVETLQKEYLHELEEERKERDERVLKMKVIQNKQLYNIRRRFMFEQIKRFQSQYVTARNLEHEKDNRHLYGLPEMFQEEFKPENAVKLVRRRDKIEKLEKLLQEADANKKRFKQILSIPTGKKKIKEPRLYEEPVTVTIEVNDEHGKKVEKKINVKAFVVQAKKEQEKAELESSKQLLLGGSRPLSAASSHSSASSNADSLDFDGVDDIFEKARLKYNIDFDSDSESRATSMSKATTRAT